MFHFCGNPFHDIPMNLIVLMSFLPDWMPFVTWFRLKALQRAPQEDSNLDPCHQEGHHCHCSHQEEAIYVKIS